MEASRGLEHARGDGGDHADPNARQETWNHGREPETGGRRQARRMDPLPTLSLEHSAYIIVKLTRHAVEGFGYDLRLRGAGSKDPSHATAFVTEGIPGVSATTARGFHSRFGSVTGLFAASYDDLLATPGIGPKMARLIYDTLRAVPPA